MRNAILAPFHRLEIEARQDLVICADPAESGGAEPGTGLSSSGVPALSAAAPRPCSKALWAISCPSHHLPPLIARAIPSWGVTVSAAQAFTGETRADLVKEEGQVWVFPLIYRLGNYGKREFQEVQHPNSSTRAGSGGEGGTQECRSCFLGLITGFFSKRRTKTNGEDATCR